MTADVHRASERQAASALTEAHWTKYSAPEESVQRLRAPAGGATRRDAGGRGSLLEPAALVPIQLVGPERALTLFGVRMIGFDAATLRRLLLTAAFFVAVLVLASVLRAIARLALGGTKRTHLRFLVQQIISIVTSLLFVLVFISIWLQNPTQLAGAAALVTAGLAVAMQKFIMSLVGYIAILRGHTFRVGDRISMGGVRGDVIALGYIRTTIMEMGQPPAVQSDAPAMWVEARQYTGRIVSVTNDKIFDQPVYNFTREFPYLFEEMRIPIKYTGDRRRAEQVLLEAAEKHTVPIREISREHLDELSRRYFLRPTDLTPRVYYRLTDNWVELTVRFVVREWGVRDVKDSMSRDILAAFETAKIEIASATFEVVGLPEVHVRT
jgi:small-conductance mechanosensitive channel